MKRFLCLLLLALALSAQAASVKISDLPLKSSVSTNTFIEVADMNAATKSGKWLLSRATLWSDFGSYIAPTSATNNFKVSTNGNITIGGTYAPTLDGRSFEAVRNTALGEPDYNELWVNAINGIGGSAQLDYSASLGGNYSDLFMQYDSDGVNGARSYLHLGLNDAYFRLYQSGSTSWMKLWPTTADGASAVAYKFWTANALTNAGAKIASFGTTSEKASIGADGTFYIGTNSFRITGTNIIVNGVTR